jgi:hypothetical protein
MKPYLKTLAPISCLAAVLLGWPGTSHATIVTVDGSISAGYMAVFEIDNGGPGAFVFGQPWGFAALKSTLGATSIVLEPNYNAYGDKVDPFWRNNDGAGPGGNKWMVASSYADFPVANFPDDLCNFKAEISTNTLTEGYTVRAFVKAFNADYTSSSEPVYSEPLEAGSVINIELDVSGWVRVQYGFEVQGINANPASPQGSATAVANVPPPPIVYGIPNPGFEIPDGAQWQFGEANGHTVVYPDAGGNPGGYAEIDSTAATQPFYAVLVSNGGQQLPLAALGLTPGQTCVFAMDMKIISGDKIGGFKVDFVPSGSTGDMYPGITGDGSEWATYSFPVTIPADAIGLKLVPLWGPASVVGYDNIRVAGPFAAGIATAGSNVKISWPTVTGRSYQVRKSGDLVNWLPFGASANGNGSTFSVTDPVVPPGRSFYQVIETAP